MPKRPPPIGPKRLVVTRLARADIDEQLDYIARQAGLDVAETYSDRIDIELNRLARVGHGGVARGWISPGLRMTTIGLHCVYFRVNKEETRIIRFLRGSRDLKRLSFADTGE